MKIFKDYIFKKYNITSNKEKIYNKNHIDKIIPVNDNKNRIDKIISVNDNKNYVDKIISVNDDKFKNDESYHTNINYVSVNNFNKDTLEEYERLGEYEKRRSILSLEL